MIEDLNRSLHDGRRSGLFLCIKTEDLEKPYEILRLICKGGEG